MSETKRLWADDIRARYGADMRAQYVLASDYDRDLAEMRRQINAMRQDCNTMCNALQRIEAGERDPRMIARRTLEHWSEKAALTSKEPRDDA